MFAEDDIERRRVERKAADRAYNDALTALDRAVPRVTDLPHPPVEYDESQLPLLNERWRVATADPAAGLTGWRRRVAMAIWRVAGPAFDRQQAFNAALVDHLNRNVAAHRANRQSIEATIGAMHGELEKLETFHTTLVLYLQTITRFVDTKDRSEHIATLANLTSAGLAGVAAVIAVWKAGVVAALAPVIGYDRAAEIAHLARNRDLTLKEATLKLGYLSAEDFDRLVNPYKMAHPEG